ncbi:hypothetical protein [Clostridium tunisiense]|uniref:hypothetical protein n=1 Tax=Clostridium tunisiense TaxID=219748 RepID=UPI0002F19F71|nr:hypothetical protein [Clostridium tunisiense]
MRRKLTLLTFLIVALFAITYKNHFIENFINESKSIVTTAQVSSSIHINNKNEEYEVQDSRIILKKVYKNIRELKADADIIIEGRVINAKSEMYDENIPITYTEVEIYDVFKTGSNDVLKGSKVCIIDEGGIIPKEILIKEYKNKFPDKFFDPKEFKDVKSTNDGIPPMEMGEHFIVFAQRFQGKSSKDNCYIVLGSYQGKFKIEEDKVTHQVPMLLEEKFEDKVKTKEELINLINTIK